MCSNRGSRDLKMISKGSSGIKRFGKPGLYLTCTLPIQVYFIMRPISNSYTHLPCSPPLHSTDGSEEKYLVFPDVMAYVTHFPPDTAGPWPVRHPAGRKTADAYTIPLLSAMGKWMEGKYVQLVGLALKWTFLEKAWVHFRIKLFFFFTVTIKEKRIMYCNIFVTIWTGNFSWHVMLPRQHNP